MILKTQFELLLYSFFIGIYLGVTYDLLYYFIFIYLKKVVKYFCDILFFVCQGFIIFQVIYKINNGIIPLYCFIFFGLGFLIYYTYSQSYYENNIYPLRKLFYRIINKVLKVLTYLFIKPFVDTYEFLFCIYEWLSKKIIGCVKRVKRKIVRQIKTKKANKIKNKT
ncbi:spore cortex biosynthesis protein YabQ [Mycoplasmatota bacterium]|nr:spore cortex biosynthesis protein YabQ [Mycoplasmatota bacterium]